MFLKGGGSCYAVKPLRGVLGRLAVLNNPHDQLLSVGSHHRKKKSYLQNRHKGGDWSLSVKPLPPVQGVLRTRNREEP